MRIIRITVLMLLIATARPMAQPVCTSDSSMVSFFSSTPLENIEAHSSVSTSVLNVAEKELQFSVPMTGFQFGGSLMQEHFNENYLETEKFPHATFKGRLSDLLDLSRDTVYNVTATGTMNIHGVSHADTYTGTIESCGGTVMLNCEFTVMLKDHGIKVPKVVFTSIAQEIEVKVFFRYRPYGNK